MIKTKIAQIAISVFMIILVISSYFLIRDFLEHKKSNDSSIELIENVITEFSNNGWKVSEAGKQFLVCIISKNGNSIEIANFRNDLTYIDGRRPEGVEIGTIEEDANRRDTTINALYLDPYTSEILDPTGKGLLDLKNKIIRMNGKAEDRIKEDLLRIMRVYRFASVLKFEIDKKTLIACRKHFNEMMIKIPGERIKNEIEKIVGI